MVTACVDCGDAPDVEFEIPSMSNFSKTNMFTVYAMNGCSHCEKVKELLHLTEQQFVVYTLGEQFDRDAFYGEFGEGSTFPQVVVDGKKLGGCTDTIKYLKENQVIKT